MGKQTQHGWRYGGGCGAAPPSPMNILSWNCRGLGNPRSVLALTKMVKAEAPLLIFLVETKANIAHMSKIQTKLDYTQGIIVPSNGKNGGLALL